MTTQIERLRQEIKAEAKQFAVQLLLGVVTLLLAACVAIGRFWLFHI